MTAIKLETLALRGVTVLTGGKTNQVRAGFGCAAEQPPAPLSMRHPSPGCRAEAEPEPIPAVNGGVDASATRAGRSDSPAGVLSASSHGSRPITASAWRRQAFLRNRPFAGRAKAATAGASRCVMALPAARTRRTAAR
ncbi:MAG TPA: hypothetical protein VFA26_16790 [Gemmataceae bacterium]|nr:hypothetical protein [Gemmataceae bacterium]